MLLDQSHFLCKSCRPCAWYSTLCTRPVVRKLLQLGAIYDVVCYCLKFGLWNQSHVYGRLGTTRLSTRRYITSFHQGTMKNDQVIHKRRIFRYYRSIQFLTIVPVTSIHNMHKFFMDAMASIKTNCGMCH